MALVDVTSLLVDPDFIDPMQIIHRAAYVNSLGENVVTETIENTIGSIQPASGKTLERLPEEFRVANVSSFWVRGNIISDGKSKYPDLLTFHGQTYAVQTIMDYSNWGSGWSEGTAVRQVPAL